MIQLDNGEGTFSVSYRKAQSHNMPASHFHSTYEIFYLIAGNREFFIKDRTILIEEGDIVIIAPNILHRTTNTENPAHERLIVNIHESRMAVSDPSYMDMLQPLIQQEYVIVKNLLHGRHSFQELSRQMIEEVRDKQPGYETFVHSLVLQLLIMCCRHIQQYSMVTLESPSPMHERISEVVRYINSHYMHALSLHMLAEHFYVSPYYLSRFFKEATGFTFVEYLNSVRVKEAKKLLEDSSVKVNLIARKVGFGSVTHFGRVFKTVTGHTPLYYRRRI